MARVGHRLVGRSDEVSRFYQPIELALRLDCPPDVSERPLLRVDQAPTPGRSLHREGVGATTNAETRQYLICVKPDAAV
jgi:hypothetical protein